jgi:cellulose synthase/poly-beta-1,6-N-acetylglucosamine synthase-like glycosyltransferase
MAILAWLLVGVAAVPVLVLAAECVAAAAGGTDDMVPGFAPPFAVIMPAHDEAGGIGRSITAALAQLRPGDRLIVVADNCIDDTAAAAQGLGAEVVERYSADLRGKGFALAAGRAALGPVPPPVVIVLDADCIPAAGALPRLAAEVARTGAVVQACYLLSSREMQGPGAQISNFAFAVKNFVRQRGLGRLGAPALLQGTGMGFPADLFDVRRLASASLVEDMELGLGLVLAGHRVRFLESALFTSAASARDATMTQRTRWEHGSIVTGWRHAPSLVAAALRGRPALFLLALDLIVPPLALLAGLLAVAMLAGAVLAFSGGGAGPLLGTLVVAGLFVASISLAWRLAGREFVAARTLLRVPGYMLWKLPIYWRLLVDRQRAWVRTRRDA